ncbi:MAG TPA: DUF2892 domain-containing protein [Candidatus Xenobia bacterium]|nr:DUF2892 domain-containing protein [Candidatus Xenobia bacterium]
MTVERTLRLLAGVFVLVSLALGYWVSPYWYLFTAFVGLNLLQSGFTNWCPMMTLLRKLGVRGAPVAAGITQSEAKAGDSVQSMRRR